MGGPAGDLMLLIAIVMLVIAWVVVRAVGRRPVHREHPTCRRCQHDLFGLPASSTHCPECGSDLSRPRAMLPPGTRRRAPAWLTRSLVLSLVASTLWLGWRAGHRPEYVEFMPDLALLYHVGTSRPQPILHDLAADVLRDRTEARTLGSIAIWIATRAALTAEPLDDREDACGSLHFVDEVFGELVDTGQVDDATLVRYIDRRVRPIWLLPEWTGIEWGEPAATLRADHAIALVPGRLRAMRGTVEIVRADDGEVACKLEVDWTSFDASCASLAPFDMLNTLAPGDYVVHLACTIEFNAHDGQVLLSKIARSTTPLHVAPRATRTQK